MKDKTYRWVLGLFLALLYGVLIIFSIFNIKDNYSRIKESYLREYSLLGNNFVKELLAMESRKFEIEEAIEVCYKDYFQQYKDQDISLEIYKDGKCIFYEYLQDENTNRFDEFERPSSNKNMIEIKLITYKEKNI